MQKLIALFVVMLIGCTPAGGIRPTSFTYPNGYLKTFPLGSITESELLAKVGPPTRTNDLAGKKAYIYQVGTAGNRTYTYLFDGETVSDVIYNENGMLNGITAKTEQQK